MALQQTQKGSKEKDRKNKTVFYNSPEQINFHRPGDKQYGI